MNQLVCASGIRLWSGLAISPLFRFLALLTMLPALMIGCTNQSDLLRQIPANKQKVLLLQGFQNNSTAPDRWNPWSRGLPMMIQSDLMRVGYFRVVSAESRATALEELAFSKSGLTEKTIEIGQLLGADWIVSGSFVVVGMRLELTATVTDTRTGSLVASSSKGGPVSAFFEVAKEASLDLLSQFQFDLKAGEVVVIRRAVETRSLEASLKNYAGESLLLQVRLLELRMREPHADVADLSIEVEALKKKAALRFARALDSDAEYQRAKDNLNGLTLMLPSSI